MIALNYDYLSYCGTLRFFMAVKWDVKGILEDNWCYLYFSWDISVKISCPTYLDNDYKAFDNDPNAFYSY